jgi:hypothetical protein
VLDTEAKSAAAVEVLGDTRAWIGAYCPAESLACGADTPGDASGQWAWFDEEVGLCRIVALHHRSFTVYHIH